jgi:hypothetical protein
MTAHEALTPELARLLVIRDLTAAARHALEMQPDSDGVFITLRVDKNGLSVDCTHTVRGAPLTGWGQ